ncbi:MAG: D-alanine--D-alanine ligase family protein [Phycisphaerales bacterium]
MTDKLTVLVLGGGPDRERDVSLVSAAQVADALRAAGHRTLERDILPNDTSALDETFDVVFPVLHGAFGEGGPLQQLLEQRGVPFVGCGSKAAGAAMDKVATKQVARQLGIPTPDWQVFGPTDALTLQLPVVIKPLNEGSSVGVFICHTEQDVTQARSELHGRHPRVMAERFIRGREMTVGVFDGRALPVIEIIPSVTFYDYQAKYSRDDTRYSFDVLPEVAEPMRRDAVTLFQGLGCRHLSRVDFIVDAQNRPWMLEINTMPGFTTHSLLPMAARKSGIEMPALCDKLVKLALQTPIGR